MHAIRRYFSLSAATLGLATLGCAARPAVRAEVVDGTRAESLTVQVRAIGGALPRVRAVRIVSSGRRYRVGGVAYWALVPAGGARVAPLPTLRYGVEPPGFTATRAQSLGPGRYGVDVTDANDVHEIVWFRVSNHGIIQATDPPAT